MPEAPQAQEQGGGGASKLVAGIHSGLMQLQDLLAQSQVADDGDKQQLAQLIQAYTQFVDGLGSAPGQSQGGQPPMRGPAPMEAGASGAKPMM